MIIALSSRHGKAEMTYASLYVAFSQVKMGSNIWLLLNGHAEGDVVDWSTLNYIPSLKVDTHIKAFFARFPKEGEPWDQELALAELARFSYKGQQHRIKPKASRS